MRSTKVFTRVAGAALVATLASGKIVATVKRVAPAKGVPTGTVDFSVDGGWISTETLDAKGLPVFTPRSFTMSSWNPVGCNVTIFNNTPNTLLLAYGTPGAWKRLPFGTIAPGAARGIGVGMANYTGYFTTTANLSNYVAIHCV